MVMAYIVMAYIVMACIVMAYIVMAKVVLACHAAGLAGEEISLHLLARGDPILEYLLLLLDYGRPNKQWRECMRAFVHAYARAGGPSEA